MAATPVRSKCCSPILSEPQKGILRDNTWFCRKFVCVGSVKTALLEAAAKAAFECGFQIGRGTTSPLKEDVPLGVVRQLFKTMHHELPAVDVVSAARHGRDVITCTFNDMTSGFEDVLVHNATQGVHRIAAQLAQRTL